jgi:hypothetical protein
MEFAAYDTCTCPQYTHLAYVISFLPYYWRAMQVQTKSKCEQCKILKLAIFLGIIQTKWSADACHIVYGGTWKKVMISTN